MREYRLPNEGLGHWLARRAELTSSRVAIVYWASDDVCERWTCGELDAAARRLAAWMHSRGIGPGDRVAFHDFNDVRFAITMFAAAYAGAIFVPLNFRLAEPELLDVLVDCDARLVIHGEAFEPLLDGLHARMPRALSLLSHREAHGALDTLIGDAEGGQHSPVPVDGSQTAMLLYTSGSTGRPKGVMLSHWNLFWNTLNTVLIQGGLPSDSMLISAPLFHAAPLSSFLEAFLRGAVIHLERSFQSTRVLARIASEHVNVVAGVPAMYAMMAADPEFARTDLSSLRAIIVGGSPVPEALTATYRDRDVCVIQRYGLTEAAPLVTGLSPDSPESKAMTAGLPGMFVEMRISRPDAEGIGEIQARGPNIMQGYWQRHEQTQDVFEDGWLRTGDLGRVDDDGYLQVAGRCKDMIISGGENIYAAEVEARLTEVNGVLEAAVIGVPHPKWGETAWALVAPRSGASITSEHVLDHLQGRLARYKHPTRVIIVDELPKNGAGKVDKLVLRERYRAGA